MTTLTIRNASGEPIEDVPVKAINGGLAVTKAGAYDRKYAKSRRWRITHLASGHGIGFFANLPDAKAALAKLLACGIDWTLGRDAIVTADNAAKVRAAIGQL